MGETGLLGNPSWLNDLLPDSEPAPEKDRLLTIQQVAAMLNVSIRTAWSLRATGKLRGRLEGPGRLEDALSCAS